MIDRTALQRLGLRAHYADWTDSELDEALASHIDLASRESYLAWVAEWKALYRAVAGEIRGHKRDRKTPDVETAALEHFQRERKRHLARTLLALRHYGKRASWRRKLEADRQPSRPA